MFRRTALIGLAALSTTFGSGAAARADHLYQFFFRGTITSIEGTPPIGVTPGETFSANYLFDAGTPDAEPFPGVGSYSGAIRSARVRTLFPPYSQNMTGGPITIIDNSALGDVYRVALSNAATGFNVGIELIDAESGAVNSDSIMTTLDLNLYTGKFDVARMVLDAPSPAPAPPGSTYRLIATIEFIETLPVFCRCDWNQDDVINSQDFFDFIADFFTGGGDYIPDGVHNSQDLFDFLNCFFNPVSSCP